MRAVESHGQRGVGYSYSAWSGLKRTFMAILILIMYLALAACMESQKTSAPLPAPTVYEWMGPGPTPSLPRLAQDRKSVV